MSKHTQYDQKQQCSEMQCMVVFRLLFAHVACAKPEAYYRLVLASQTQYRKQFPEAPR